MSMRMFLMAMLFALPVGAGAQEWAMGGYDAVAFLNQDQAVPGQAGIVTYWKGQNWHFASEENRSKFEMNPRAYAPGFGGLCVVTLSEGRAEPGNPRYFVTIGNRVYLTGSESKLQKLKKNPKLFLMEAKTVWLRLFP